MSLRHSSLGRSLLAVSCLTLCAFSASDAADMTNSDEVILKANEYPVVKVVEAFRDACGQYSNQEEAAKNVAKAGWVAVQDPSTSPLADFLEHTKGQMLKLETVRDAKSFLVFEKLIESEDVFIVLTEFVMGSRRVAGCRLYDVDEQREVHIADIEKWIGRKKIAEQNVSSAQVSIWQPAFHPDQFVFEVHRYPKDSKLAVENKFNGIMLRLDTVGAM
jgi:quinol monooxygenase YgiN